jgi:hypothetical protein
VPSNWLAPWSYARQSTEQRFCLHQISYQTKRMCLCLLSRKMLLAKDWKEVYYCSLLDLGVLMAVFHVNLMDGLKTFSSFFLLLFFLHTFFCCGWGIILFVFISLMMSERCFRLKFCIFLLLVKIVFLWDLSTVKRSGVYGLVAGLSGNLARSKWF